MDVGRSARRDDRRGHQVERAHMVERAAGQTDVRAGEAELGGVRVVLPREVGVGDHHALGAPGRAGGVHEPLEVVAGGWGAFDRRGRAIGDVVEAHPAGPVLAPDQDAIEGRERPRGVGAERGQFGVRDQDAGLRVLKDVGEFRRGEPPVQRHHDRAEVVRGEDRRQEVDTVVGEQRHDVTRRDAPDPQAGGDGGGPVEGTPVADDVAVLHGERPVRGAGRMVLENADPVHVRGAHLACLGFFRTDLTLAGLTLADLILTDRYKQRDRSPIGPAVQRLATPIPRRYRSRRPVSHPRWRGVPAGRPGKP
ncbi:hypothetical protein FAIPA1_80042 [Frankia sp. AiPs1]